jgi:hypothetical protein
MALDSINADIAIVALSKVKRRCEVYSAYLRTLYLATGLTTVKFTRPQLIAWYRKNMPEAWQVLTDNTKVHRRKR